ncbi:hypothetical protein EPO15_09110 [bacterium]|nr:MAG: hypothetical protein EPO15_09110 [bacterium]
MKTPLLLAALAVAAPLSAFSQTPAPHRFASAVQTALVAMRDGVEAGGEVADAIEASRARVVAEEMSVPSALRRDRDGTPVIVLDARLPLAPRVLAPRLAREGAKLLLKDMPESAEKAYMARSLEVRTWVELGGEPAKLPVIDPLTGASDPALAADFKAWLDVDAQTALERLGRAAGAEDLPTQMDAISRDLDTRFHIPENVPPAKARLAALEAANRRFVDFLRAERDWKQMHGL